MVHKVTGAGWTGVDLFFVLSGFLITGILFEAKQHAGHYFRGFYIRRVLRIFPANYGYLAALFVLIPLLAPASAQAAVDTLAKDRWWFATFLTNVLVIIHGATRPDFFITGHLWSLAVEEQFYLTWPALVLLLNRGQMMRACLAIIVLAPALRIGMTMAGADGAVSLTLTPARMDSLAIGGLIALALHDQRDLALLTRFLPPVAIIAAIAAAAIAAANGGLHALDRPVYTVGYTLVALAFGGFMLQAIRALPASTTYRWLTTPVLTSAGRYSYMMYLVHLPIAWLLLQRADIASDVPTLAGSHLPGEALFALIAFVPTFAIAWLSWRVLETPFLRLKDRLAGPRGERDSAPNPPLSHRVTTSAPVAEDA
jgi:peptidoglycan/LPS O-acetylase OafA/YrhL